MAKQEMEAQTQISKSSTTKQQHNNNQKYTCVTCQAPSSTLYTVPPSSLPTNFNYSSIKLTKCQVCNNNVDPYIEYELLLIIMDCILFRLKAYRHLLFNRSKIMEDTTAMTLLGGMNGGGSFGVMQYVGVTSLLDCLLKYQSLPWNDEHNMKGYIVGTTSPPISMEEGLKLIQLFIVSFIEQIALLMGIICTARFILYLQSRACTTDNDTNKEETSAKSTTTNDGDDPAKLLYQSIFLPSNLFHFVTLLIISIWEKTDIVRILGSTYILIMRSLAIKVMLERSTLWSETRRKNGTNERVERKEGFKGSIFVPMMPLLVGIMLRSIVQPLLFLIYSHNTTAEDVAVSSLIQQCSGLEMKNVFYLLKEGGLEVIKKGNIFHEMTICLT